ncbi:hypothetical protein DXG01_013441 [Tephrocybe rancida]|nr:hypothetical protein DXG01_013441 [Tephrocybe rancida]
MFLSPLPQFPYTADAGNELNMFTSNTGFRMSSPSPMSHNVANQLGLTTSNTIQQKALSAVEVLQIIQNASHETLLQSGNHAYGQMWLQNVKLNTESTGIKSSFKQIFARLPSSGEIIMLSDVGPPNLPLGLTATQDVHVVLLCVDFPQVKFWEEPDWLSFQATKKAEEAGYHQVTSKHPKNPDASPETLAYIQDEHGQTITVKCTSNMTARAQAIWEYLRLQGMAPPSWGKVSALAQEYYLKNIYKGFDELQLCEGDWKATCLAIKNYSGWTRTALKLDGAAKAVVKMEMGVKSEDESQTSPLKCRMPPLSSEPKPRKQLKEKKEDQVVGEVHTPIFHHVAYLYIHGTPPTHNHCHNSYNSPAQSSAPCAADISSSLISIQEPASTAMSSSDSIRLDTEQPAPNAGTSLPQDQALVMAEDLLANNSHVPTMATTNTLGPRIDGSDVTINASNVASREASGAGGTDGAGAGASVFKEPACTTTTIKSGARAHARVPTVALFKPSKTSCFQLNLFGTNYCLTHALATKDEVKAAFNSFTAPKCQHWNEECNKKLALKKA